MEDAGRVRLPGLALVQVANVFPALAAISPDVVLNEPGEVGREGRIELPAVNPAGEVVDHPQTPGVGVAPGPVGMVSPVVRQNPGPVEESVDQAVDRNHVETHLAVVPAGVAGQEQARQRHVGELRADVGNGGDFPDEVVEPLIDGLSGRLALPKVVPDEGVKVPPTNIPEEEIERERHLVQRPSFHVEPREGTRLHEGGFSAVVRRLPVAAPFEGLKRRLISGTGRP